MKKKNQQKHRKNTKQHFQKQECITVVGCSGYTNIGDDMYPLVLKKYFRDYNFVFKNSDLPRRLPVDTKLLIMGPGGIIYQDETAHAEYMIEYMEQAIKRKIPIVFLSCGVQSIEIGAWKKYLDAAELITVRSKKDFEYISTVSDNRNLFHFPDLGYLFDEYEYVPGLPEKYTLFIPIAKAKNDNSQEPVRAYRELPKEERVLLRMGSIEDVQANYPSWLEQGEAKTIVNVNPAMVNYIIQHASMVYTGRYHGLVFARKNKVPFHIGAASQLKLQNEDMTSNVHDALFHISKLGEIIKKHITYKKQKRVAIIHDDFAISGGGEKLISILSESLNKKGYTTEIFTFNVSENTKKMLPDGLIIHTLKDKKTLSNDDAVKRYLFSELKLQNHFHFFIFSGHSSLCAARHNTPNLLYAHNIPKSEPSFPSVHPYEEVIGAKNPHTMLVLNEDDVQVYLNTVKEIHILEKLWRKAYAFKMRYIEKPILPQSISNKMDAVRFLLNRSLTRISKFKFLTYQFTNKENLRYVQTIVTNSENIKQKIKKKYKRDADIIYPPIETSTYTCKPHANYWLSINRIVPLKRIEIQIEAFKRLPEEKLIVVGDFEHEEYFKYIQSISPKNVTFLGVISEDEKIRLLSECKGFIFTAKDEDFGMSVVEAMASGKPVIAPREGGCIETVVHEKTGYLIENIDADSVVYAIRKINLAPESYAKECIQQARKFDSFFFTQKIIDKIEQAHPFNKTVVPYDGIKMRFK